MSYRTLIAAFLLAWGCTGPALAQQPIQWKYATLVPKNFPVFGTGADRLAQRIERMSGGRLTIKVFAAGELVAPFEIFDAVSAGTIEMGQGTAYFWKGKIPAAQFLSTVPFGMTAQELNAWMLYGGGLEYWEQLYEPFGVLPVLSGNTGVQMVGWFNKEINSVADLQGLKMRVPGIGGEVLKRAGVTTILLPGTEMFQALQSGTIDAVDWIGPFNDRGFGLYQAAKYYYWPGWHEPGGNIETLVNKAALSALPEDLQAVVLGACRALAIEMLSEFTARNPAALQDLVENHSVELRRLPAEVIEHLRDLTDEVVGELTAADPVAAQIYTSMQTFQKQAQAWHNLSERAFMAVRDAPAPPVGDSND